MAMEANTTRRAVLKLLPAAVAAGALPVAAAAVAMHAAEHPNEKVRRLTREIAQALRDPRYLGFRKITVTSNASIAHEDEDDADLMILGAEFERLFRAEIAVMPEDNWADWSAWDAAYAKTERVVRQIEKCTATSVEGLRIKARAILWCHNGEFGGLESESTDLRLAEQIVRDLLAMSVGAEPVTV